MSGAMGPEALVALLEGGPDRVVLIDSRPFVDFNGSHILEAVNVNCSKLMKRRLQQDKVHIQELLQHSARKQLDLQGDREVVVYDQSSWDPAALPAESFLGVLLLKLRRSFPSVHLLAGGFSAFSRLFPGLCEGRAAPPPPSATAPPCQPLASAGPTCILPHLYLGCQRDVLNKEVMQQNDIVFVLNVSNSCPKPDFISDSHFLRVPVNDSFCEKILPWLDRSLDFIEEAKACQSRVLVHCLAGISRSATIAIAYIMKRMDMSLDEAYRFVKEKRPTISPNFNFLGQLLDFEKKIKSPGGAEPEEAAAAAAAPGGPGVRGPALLEPLTLPCALADAPEERLLARALSGLALADGGGEDGARPKRSFSLDIKSYGEPGAGSAHRVFAPHGGAGDAADFFKASAFKESKPCQFSPVQEVSEQSTPEHSPDKEEAEVSAPPAAAAHPLHRSGSVEDSATCFLFGALKGWHSDILSTSSLSGARYPSSDSARFYSGAYGRGLGPEAVRRRGGARPGDRGASRRSWHEESSFEKQLKRRSCQMEFGDGRLDSRSGEDLGTLGSQASFSGSVEVIQVS